jgi:hypothetical protein
VTAAAGTIAAAMICFACADDASDDGDDGPAGLDAGGEKAAVPPSADDDGGEPPGPDGGVDGGSDAGASVCELTRAYFVGCGHAEDLTCGAAKFDAWCASNDEAINSAAFRRAERMCLTGDRCDPTVRRDCEYTSYGALTPTASEAALVTAYCQTCEPANVPGCVADATAYDAAGGPAAVTDVFVAAWELSDPVVDEIRTSCTGAALDGGAGGDAAACAKAFGGCAADVYLAHLPDCPP